MGKCQQWRCSFWILLNHPWKKKMRQSKRIAKSKPTDNIYKKASDKVSIWTAVYKECISESTAWDMADTISPLFPIPQSCPRRSGCLVNTTMLPGLHKCQNGWADSCPCSTRQQQRSPWQKSRGTAVQQSWGLSVMIREKWWVNRSQGRIPWKLWSLTITKYTFISSTYGTFRKIGQSLGHKENLNKLPRMDMEQRAFFNSNEIKLEINFK